MQLWQDILVTAVVGTEQQELALASRADDLGRLLAQFRDPDRACSLLNAASLVSLYRRAGFAPTPDTQPTPAGCETDEMDRACSAAGQHLALMLAGEFKEVLPEWLGALSRNKKRVPEERLPALLDTGRAEPPLREMIFAVLGKRGEWLAAQNPDWTYATRRDDQDVWETGSRDERLLLLEKLCAANSTRAKDLLAATWPQESARDRAAFLERLAAGLTADDEDLLNEALHDRSVEVRRVARGILARLPESQFSKRMKELIGQVLIFKKPMLGKARIEVLLPDDPLDWLRTNGIDLESPPRDSASQSLGPKGWCLREMVALIPVKHWVDLWRKAPSEIIRAAFETEWERSFAEGFVQAARRDRDPDWIEALVAHWLANSKQPADQSSLADAAAYLPAFRLEALILTLLKTDSKGLDDTHPALRFLLAHRGDWSDQLSRAVISSIKKRINSSRKDGSVDWQTRAALKQFARHVSPALYDELVLGWPMESEGWSGWSKGVDAFQSLLAFRCDMHKAILAKEQKT